MYLSQLYIVSEAKSREAQLPHCGLRQRVLEDEPPESPPRLTLQRPPLRLLLGGLRQEVLPHRPANPARKNSHG